MDRKYAFAALPLLAAVLFAPVSTKAGDDPDKPVLVHMQAALDIDRDGRVQAVEFVDDRKLPEALRLRAKQTALSWKFHPPTKEGKPVSGRTYAGIQACLVPRGDTIDFNVTLAGNGPAGTYRPPRKSRSPELPIRKLMQQGIDHVKGKVVYVVSVDGAATVESATLDDPSLQAEYGHLWLKDQREFFKYHRYRPELIDGRPTTTRMESDIENWWVRSGDRKAKQAQLQAHDEGSDACRALRDDNGRQIASDSLFKRIDG